MNNEVPVPKGAGAFFCCAKLLAASPSPSLLPQCHLSQRERPWHSGKVSGSSAKCAGKLKASPGRGSLSKREVLAVHADFIFLPRALPLGELPNKVRLRGRARYPNAIRLFCIQKLCYTVLNRRNGRAFTPSAAKESYGIPQLEQKRYPHFPFGLRLYALSHQDRRHH